jgi:hypothetical protein
MWWRGNNGKGALGPGPSYDGYSSLSLFNNQQPPFLNLTPAIYYDGVSDMHYLLRYMY